MAVEVEYQEMESKSVLNKHNFINPWGWNRYSAHAYIGCEHACEYCYERHDKYLHHDSPEDFSRIIKVKTNAPELLARQLTRVRKDVVALDRYQPAELTYRLNRRMLETIRDLSFPCFILEKSAILLKDMDILADISGSTWCNVAYSLSVLEEKLFRIFEPGAPPPEERLAAVSRLSAAGIMVGVFLLPVIPFIADDEAALDQAIGRIKAAGAKYVLVGPLTLSRSHKLRFMKLLAQYFPEIVNKYERLYRSGQGPNPTYLTDFARRAARLCRKHGIADFVPRGFIPQHMPPPNYQVSTMLFHLSYLLEGGGEPPYRYQAYSRAAQAVEALSEDIETLLSRNRLEEIPGVGKKIGEIIRERLTTGKCGYYEKLREGYPGE